MYHRFRPCSLKSLILSLFLAPLSLLASIVSIGSITEISQLDLGDHEVLAVFDIDDTLTILQEPAFQRPNFRTHHAKIFSEIMDALSVEEKLLSFTLPLITTSGELLEIQAPEIIRNFQSRGVKTLALTAAMAGKIQDVFIEDRRLSELSRVGIDFSSSFPEIHEAIYPNFQASMIGTYPYFKKGVIFTNDHNKGAVLVEFLKTLSWTPTLILFVDDRHEHLDAVEKALTHFNSEIQFKGFHIQIDPSCYKKTDAENFRNQWMDCIEQAKQILKE